MKRIIMILLMQGILLEASFMDTIGDVVKSTLEEEDESKIPEIQTVGTLKTVEKRSSNSEKKSLLDDMLDDVKDSIGFKKEKKEKSFVNKTLTAMKEVTGLKKVKPDNELFDGGLMGEIADMIDLEKGESWGLPSVFGINKKKQKKVFGSTILAGTILGDTKDATTSLYRGFKHSGESAEFMSGVMYKSSKMYNGMFEMFDDSAFNIFDDKDEREPSVFDVLKKGNDALDMFK